MTNDAVMPDSYISEDLVEVLYCPLRPGSKCSIQCAWWLAGPQCCVLIQISDDLASIRAARGQSVYIVGKDNVAHPEVT